MVTATQLQIIQSPITNLVSTISASVNVKLDDANYLNWHFQMQLLLESNGIFGFVDGSHSCPSSISTECGIDSTNSSSTTDCDDVLVWRMHDRAIMQLITATLSPVALSCAIGSYSSRDLWMRLKEQFSTVSKTSIFQMKSNLQNIQKGTDTISQYLLRIKEARDYLTAAGVIFADEDIVILALNGLPPEYNTLRCVIRGRESVITLKEFRSQLLAEERIVENINSSYLTAMHSAVKPNVSASSTASIPSSFHGPHGFNSYGNVGYRSFNRNRGRGRFNSTQRPHLHGRTHALPNRPQGPFSNSPTPICQLCNMAGHLAPLFDYKRQERFQCNICGKTNHTSWFCFYNTNGPNYEGPPNGQGFVGAANDHQSPAYAGAPHGPSFPTLSAMHTEYHPSHQFSQQPAMTVMHPAAYNSHQLSQQPALSAMNTGSQSSSQMWLMDSGATNHMTADLSNLRLSTPYPIVDTVQTANGEGQIHGADTLQREMQ